MPIFLPGEPEFDQTETTHAWMEAVLLAEYGEQDGMPDTADIPAALNWFDLVPLFRRFDFETVECSMVYHSPSGDYACSLWDATGENDDPWAVFVVDDFGPRFLPEYSLMDENVTETERDAVLLRAQNEIPDRAEAGEWTRHTAPSGPLVIPDYLCVPRPKEIKE